MKLLVKVIETESSDAPQIAIGNMTWDFLANARISVNEAELMSHELKAPVSLRIDNNEGEYFMVRRRTCRTSSGQMAGLPTRTDSTMSCWTKSLGLAIGRRSNSATAAP